MTKEDRELLLKDLCARLPYGVKVESVFINPNTKEHKLCGIEVLDATSILMIRDGLGEFKPYLFPLSSITEEQKKELSKLGVSDDEYELHDDIRGLSIIVNEVYIFFEFCYKHHIDFLGLIDKGLAIDATGKNIY